MAEGRLSYTMPTMAGELSDRMSLRSSIREESMSYTLVSFPSSYPYYMCLRPSFSHGWYGLLESLCDNKEMIETNIRNVKISSPDVRISH